MLLRHVGLTASTEENSDKFYRDLLGLKKAEPKYLSAQLSRAIFNIDAQLQIINYRDENLHFEIFINPQISTFAGRIDHQCIEVDDLPSVIEKCRSLDVEVALIHKNDKTLTFIKDFDGNLFELNQK